MKTRFFILTILLGAAALLSVYCSTSGPGTVTDNCYIVASDARNDNHFPTIPVLTAFVQELPDIGLNPEGYHVPKVINPKEWKPYVFDQLMKEPRSNC